VSAKIFQLIKIQIGLTFVVLAYPCCLGKEAVKRVYVSRTMATFYKGSEAVNKFIMFRCEIS